MTKLIWSICIAAGLIFSPLIFAKTYSQRLCTLAGYHCIKVKRGDSWHKLWPNPEKRRIVMRLNRMNTRMRRGMLIAVPDNLNGITHMDISPVLLSIPSQGRKIIVLNLERQAFGAYNRNGSLVHWGPISGGKGWCPDVNRFCRTPRGTYYVYTKGTAACKSSKYPVPEGGAPMPYCMFFYGGYAMHASDLPGYHASHGCVRMFYEDAEWLNKDFINMGKKGTKVIVK